jgi:hypothetical protein
MAYGREPCSSWRLEFMQFVISRNKPEVQVNGTQDACLQRCLYLSVACLEWGGGITDPCHDIHGRDIIVNRCLKLTLQKRIRIGKTVGEIP